MFAQAQAVELAQVRERLALTEQAAKATTEQHAAELARMNSTVQAERTRHQQDAELLRTELTEQKQAGQVVAAERDQACSELVTLKAKAEVIELAHQEQRKRSAEEVHGAITRLTQAEDDRDEARKLASAAREDAAMLRGQVEAMQAQQTALLASLRPTTGYVQP